MQSENFITMKSNIPLKHLIVNGLDVPKCTFFPFYHENAEIRCYADAIEMDRRILNIMNEKVETIINHNIEKFNAIHHSRLISPLAAVQRPLPRA